MLGKILTLEYFLQKQSNFQCYKWANIVQIIQPYGHTGQVHYLGITEYFNFDQCQDFLAVFPPKMCDQWNVKNLHYLEPPFVDVQDKLNFFEILTAFQFGQEIKKCGVLNGSSFQQKYFFKKRIDIIFILHNRCERVIEAKKQTWCFDRPNRA